jgi:hypothetical protein
MAIPRKLKTTFTGGEFSPALAARVDLEKYNTGLKVAKNTFVHPHGGVSNRAGFEFVSYTRQGGLTIQVPFIASIETDETYALLFSDERIMFTRNGAPVLEPAVAGVAVTDNTGDARFTKAAHGFADGDYIVWFDATNIDLQGRMLEVELVDANTFDLFFMDGNPVGYAMASAGGAFTVRRRYSITTPYPEADIRAISYAQDNDVMYLAHVNHAPRKLSRYGDTDWEMEVIDFTPQMPAPVGLSVVVTDGAGHDPALDETVYYRVAAISATTGEESLPSAPVFANCDLALQGAKNTLSWTAGANVDRYIVYKDTAGVYGFIGATKNPTFVDNNITEDTSDGPQAAVNPFDGPGYYPRTVTLHEQRLVWASLANDPQAVFLSQSTILENYGAASPAKADDAITFRLRSRERQYIYSLVSTSAGLAMFTSTTEWMVSGGNNEAYLTPTNPVPRPQTRRGSYYLPPLLVGDVIMYAQARGGVVRDFAYSFEDDTFNGPDRTILARHLFEHRRIVSWCYAQSPYSIVWAVLDNGVLLSLTYMREHDVWGWTPHETAGLVQSVMSLPEGDEDAVYITSSRTIDGVEYQFHERMASRRVRSSEDWFFVDCGLRYTGDPVSAVGGLHHLNGMDVAVLADGYVLEGLTVLDGRVELDGAYSNVVVGLPYAAEIETLDLDMGNIPELGVIQGREMTIPQLLIHVEHTRGIWTGQNRGSMNEWKQRSTENYGAAIEPFTGKFSMDFDPDYDTTGNIVIQQRYPLPMTILAVAPDVSVGG